MSETGLDRLLDEFRRLNERFDRLEQRMLELEGTESEAPRPPSADTEPQSTHLDSERAAVDPERAFGPKTHRRSGSGHANAVSKALSMLGLVPDRPDEEKQRELSAKHQATLGKALHVLGIASDKTAEDVPAEAEASADVSPPRQEKRPGPNPIAAARAARAAMAVRAAGREPPAEDAPEPDVPGTVDAPAGPEPEAGTGQKVIITPVHVEPGEEAPEDEFVPLPEIGAPVTPEEEAAVAASSHAPIDLASAVAVDLKRGDGAVPILNAAVLLAAVGAALSAAGLVRLPGEGAAISWPELGAAAAATLLGGLALTWRRGSIHLRAAAAGLGVLSLNALSLLVLRGRVDFAPFAVGGVLALAAGVGLRLVLVTRHPLALFAGLGLAPALVFWVTVPPILALAYVLAINAAVAVGALRMRRLQSAVLAGAFTIAVFAVTPAPHAPWFAAACNLILLGQALGAPFTHRHAGRSAAVLAGVAFVFAAWTAHALYAGPALARAAWLFVPAIVSVVVGARLPRHEETLRGTLKAGAVLLSLSALPLGFSGQVLAAVGLFVALLFAVFAYTLYDASLRAAGALVLVLSVSQLVRIGGTTPLALAAAVVATVLYAVRARGSSPPALAVLLGAVGHGSLLWAIARLLGPYFTPWAWAALSLAYAAAPGVRVRTRLLSVGAVAAAGAAAVAVLLTGPAGPVRILITGALLAPHFWILRPRRAAGQILLVAELLAATAAMLAFPGPLGVLVALLLPLALAAPLWGDTTPVLRPHARFLTLVLLARCLFPDMLQADAAPAFLNLRFAALALATLPAFGMVWVGTAGRHAAGALASLVLGVAVWSETRILPVAAGIVIVASLLCALAERRVRGREPHGEG